MDIYRFTPSLLLQISLYWAKTPIVVDVARVPPPKVVQLSCIRVVEVKGGVIAVPFMLVLLAFCAVKAALSGLDTTHDCIPLVTQPIVAVAPTGTDMGFTASAINGLLICTLHCAPDVCPALFLHPSV